MKKVFVILLTVCLLVLSGCDSEFLEKLQMPDSRAPALSVTVNVQAEFELTLNYAYQVLEVKTLDSDAEALLADMELVEDSFAGSMIAILEKAREQGLLTDETVISISTQELAEGTWSVATKDMLMRPIERFYEQAGMTLNCDFTPAGETAPELFPGNTDRHDDHTFVFYYTFDDVHYLNASFYDNGEYHANYVRYHIWVTWWSDTEYTYSWYEDGVIYTYRVCSDGQFYSEVTPVIVDEYESYPPYVPGETTLGEGDVSPENAPQVTVPPETAEDGSTYEATYYSNGNIESEKYTWPNGDYVYKTYYEDGQCASYISQQDGSYFELYSDEKGNKLSEYSLDADGTETLWTYENGNMVTCETIWPDGDYAKETYHDNGVRASYIAQCDGRYIEDYYDETGNQLSSYQLNADGSEYRETYENGVRVSSTHTEANGDYTNITYYANGEKASCISNRNGGYSEDYYRENGSCISSYWKDSDSEIKWTYDENDEMTSYEEKFADGAWCLETYENGKHVLSKGYGSDGLYWENVYDENGKLIKTIREVSPGKFVEDNL